MLFKNMWITKTVYTESVAAGARLYMMWPSYWSLETSDSEQQFESGQFVCVCQKSRQEDSEVSSMDLFHVPEPGNYTLFPFCPSNKSNLHKHAYAAPLLSQCSAPKVVHASFEVPWGEFPPFTPMFLPDLGRKRPICNTLRYELPHNYLAITVPCCTWLSGCSDWESEVYVKDWLEKPGVFVPLAGPGFKQLGRSKAEVAYQHVRFVFVREANMRPVGILGSLRPPPAQTQGRFYTDIFSSCTDWS